MQKSRDATDRDIRNAVTIEGLDNSREIERRNCGIVEVAHDEAVVPVRSFTQGSSSVRGGRCGYSSTARRPGPGGCPRPSRANTYNADNGVETERFSVELRHFMHRTAEFTLAHPTEVDRNLRWTGAASKDGNAKSRSKDRLKSRCSCIPNGIRTRAATLKGWCPRPLDDGDLERTAYPAADGCRSDFAFCADLAPSLAKPWIWTRNRFSFGSRLSNYDARHGSARECLGPRRN